jgi:hypothetical protein
MKISWHQNPLQTTISLTEQEKELFRLKVIAAEMEENVGMAAFHLDASDRDKGYFDPEQAMRYLGYAQDADVGDREYRLYLSELEQGVHIGDCTCFPASCAKCHAEYILGFSTISGLGKHAAHKVYGSFSIDGITIHEVIRRLEKYEPVRSGAWLDMPEEAFTQHLPRWKAEAQSAVTWLKTYRDGHFPLGDDLETGNPLNETSSEP